MTGRSEVRLTTLLVMLMPVAGCDSTGPAPTAGVTVFARADYRGAHRTFLGDVEDLEVLGGDLPDSEDCCWGILCGRSGWTDCVSSIRIADGWQAVMYEHDTFRGDSLITAGDISHLGLVTRSTGGTWSNTISSIRVGR